MPKVNGEVMHQPLHVRPLAIPLRQAMDREGVPQVVQPRLVATAVGAPHAGMFPEPLEGILQRPAVNRRPASADEEVALGAGRRMRISPPAGVIAQHLRQVRADGNQSGLEELGIADGEQGVRQVHVCRPPGQRLPAPQPGPVQQQQDRSQGGRLNRLGKRWYDGIASSRRRSSSRE